jgi:shikimate kinase
MKNGKQKTGISAAAVILIGPKHSGKTSVGRLLAPLLGGDFIDLDEYIERRTGKSVRALYRESPENFRRAEAEALSALLDGSASGPAMRPPAKRTLYVIASGGGLAVNEAALDLLRSQGPRILTVYLDVPAEIAWARISVEAARTGELPPFLESEDPRQTHRQLHERRALLYRKIAALVVDAGDKETAALASLLASALRENA